MLLAVEEFVLRKRLWSPLRFWVKRDRVVGKVVEGGYVVSPSLEGGGNVTGILDVGDIGDGDEDGGGVELCLGAGSVSIA